MAICRHLYRPRPLLYGQGRRRCVEGIIQKAQGQVPAEAEASGDTGTDRTVASGQALRQGRIKKKAGIPVRGAGFFNFTLAKTDDQIITGLGRQASTVVVSISRRSVPSSLFHNSVRR